MMKIKFHAGPSAKAFAGFDGLKRTCTQFSKAKGGVLRCSRFKKGRGHPVCDSRLKDGGRSPGLVRKGRCKRSSAARRRRKK